MRIFSYSDFSNEAKKEENPVSLFNKDIKGLLDDMFAKVKKPKYEYDSDGYAKKVEFEIEKSDFDIDYDGEMENEYSEGVLKKREFVPVLVFSNKEESEKGGSYEIEFKIKKQKVEIKDKKEGERALQFGKDSDEQLLKKLKSRKMSDYNKEKVMDELKDRGVDYKNPFDEDEDDYDMEKEAEKKFNKKDKKNESYSDDNEDSKYDKLPKYVQDKVDTAYDQYGSDFLEEFYDLMENDATVDQINDLLDEWGIEDEELNANRHLTIGHGDAQRGRGWGSDKSHSDQYNARMRTSESATNDFYHIERGMRGNFDEPYKPGFNIDFDEVRNILDDEHGFTTVDDMQIQMYYNYLVEQGEDVSSLTDDVFADMMYSDYLYPVSIGEIDEEDFDVDSDVELGYATHGSFAGDDSQDDLGYASHDGSFDDSEIQEEPITGIEPVVTQPNVQPVQQVQPMNVPIGTIAQPVQLPTEQPVQPMAPVQQVQTPEEQEIKKWERFGIKLEIEKEEKSLNQLVNERLTIKKFSDDESLNESVNKVYENNRQPRTIETIYKNKQ